MLGLHGPPVEDAPELGAQLLEDVRPGSAIKTYDCDNLGNPNTFNEPDSPPPCQVQSGAFTDFGAGRYPHLTRDAP